MNENTEITESVREKQIRESLEKWLQSENEDSSGLRYWIKGYKFIADDQPPYTWILKSLFLRTDLKNELSRRIAFFLENEKPYQKSEMTSEDDDTFFYNLFYLSAGLNYRQDLGKQLLKILKYFQENVKEREDFFSRTKWYNLNDAFREALICNQIDSTLKEIWQAGLERRGNFFLTGDNYSWYRGIVNLIDGKHSVEPDIPAIGIALSTMSTYLKDKSEREEKFSGLVEYTQKVWRTYPNLMMDLNAQAIENNLPSWATDNSLYYPIQVNTEHASGAISFDLWDIIPNSLITIDKDLNVVSKNGSILTIEISKDASATFSFLNNLLEIVDTVRLQTKSETFPFQMKAITERVLFFETDLKYKGKYNYAGVAFQIFKKLRRFHQREEFKDQIEELYETA